MNGTEARFMRLKRCSEDEIAQLHDAERLAGENWMIAGAQALTRIDKTKDAYWPKTMTEDERERNVARFLADPVVRRAFASLDKPEESEMKCLHDADWLVYKSAPNPTTTKAQSAMANIYKRAGA